MRLGQLTGLEREKINAEAGDLRAKIADYEDIIASEPRRLEIIKTEATEIRNKYGDERKTVIESVSGEVDIEDLIPMEQCVLKKMLAKTAHSIAQIDQRPVLCGAFFKLEPDNIKVVTCDSYTLSVCDYKTPVLSMIENLERTSFIVPGKTVAELSKMLSDEEGQFLTIMVTAKNIIFNMENLVFSSRLVEGEYIDYDRLIPKDQPIEAIMDAAAFTAALERAALISEERIAGTAKNYVKLTLKDGIMQVSSRSANGNIIEEVPAEQTGDEIVIGFNCRYLIDTMRAIESEKVRVKLITPFTSVTFEPVEDEEKDDRYLYMVLPLRMKE